MGSRGRLMIDLNEIPTEDDEEADRLLPLQPEMARPDPTLRTSDFSPASLESERVKNQKVFSHASSVSGFQPFVRPKLAQGSVGLSEPRMGGDRDHNILARTSHNDVSKTTSSGVPGSPDDDSDEREEGEWSDAEGSGQLHGGSKIHEQNMASKDQEMSASRDCGASHVESGNAKVASDSFRVAKDSLPGTSSCPLPGLHQGLNDQNTSSIVTSVGNDDGPSFINGQEDTSMAPKQRDAKGIEANHSFKCANNQIKRKMDEHKEAMLGKKRSRQIVLINIDEAKQVVPNKSATPRRLPPSSIRTVKEVRVPPSPCERPGEKNSNVLNKDQKQVETSNSEASASMEACQPKLEHNGERDTSKLRRLIGDDDSSAELPLISRQGSYKQLSEFRQPRNSQLSNRKPALNSQNSTDTKLGNKKLPPPKKSTINSYSYQDTSVERLIREVTNEKLWDRPEDPELQCVPGRFESAEEYASVFEPLLFEECRAQLCSSLEELTETNTHIMVRIRSVERRERGWYDVVVLPVNECKWNFKEGDVAVLSAPRPGTVRFKRNNTEVDESEVSGRVAGTVRRHIPVDTRDPPGAILHFFVGNSYDPYSKADDDHIVRKLQTRCTWYLTVLGSLATTQREYLALHAFSRLNPQMQNAILKPSPDYFPNYEQQIPAMPECFTQNFVDHLHRSFNGPQLGAIKWAAMHTAAGTSSSTAKKQEPWPFTLVQGPPGTGKTHTVWGMLNVIHLVQYQQYYASLLKKLAPQSYKQADESSSENIPTGSIDEVLYNMDQNLFRTLSKLCPKPRMLVCAPSNAATDELLTRVLDRGFIDGEMKVYRPDVARVGVDSQSRAAQAVSVERRTEQLLVKSREEVARWMQELRGQEAFFAAQIADLQKKLNLVAADGRFQGSVGVDPDVLVARDQNRDALLQSLAAAVESRDKVLVEISRLLILESRFRGGSSFNMEEARANLEASFANEAEIVFTTVSSSGRKIFSRLSHGFDMVVIDEAAQASEVGVLPPLALGAPRCVLVGDPQQLPATVISKAAGTLLYSRSLFERFQQAGCPTMLLSVQYRMHPQIREFPSRYFYQGRLTDSESVVTMPDELYYKDPLLRPYVFYDITYGRESHRGGSVSYQNVHEAQFCMQLYEHLQKTKKSLGIGRITVGIITPYKLQLKCLQQEFSAVLKSEEGKDIYINTVDAFQGQERDVIIMSCVRASNHGVGFVADIRRMNVALTRARRALWVMGNANSLIKSDDWAALITDAKERNCFMDMDSLPKEFSVARGIQGRGTSNSRNGRLDGPRRRFSNMPMEPKSGATVDNGEHTGVSVTSRSGGYKPFKPDIDSSLDDFDQVGDKSRDAWQYGVQRRHNSFGVVGKRDL